jgi:hypothetical protein
LVVVSLFAIAYNESMPTGYSNKTGQNPFKGKKRKPFTLDHRRKMSKAMKGRTVWNKGLRGVQKHSLETRLKMSKARSDEKHPCWKGDKVGYDGLHRWIGKKKGKPKKCAECGKTKTIQWANKDHKYSRDLEDWISLCSKCHYHYDEKYLKTLHGYNRTKK